MRICNISAMITALVGVLAADISSPVRSAAIDSSARKGAAEVLQKVDARTISDLLSSHFHFASAEELRRRLLSSVMSPARNNTTLETDFAMRFRPDGSVVKTEMQIVPTDKSGKWKIEHGKLCIYTSEMNSCRVALLNSDGNVLALSVSSQADAVVDLYRLAVLRN